MVFCEHLSVVSLDRARGIMVKIRLTSSSVMGSGFELKWDSGWGLVLVLCEACVW